MDRYQLAQDIVALRECLTDESTVVNEAIDYLLRIHTEGVVWFSHAGASLNTVPVCHAQLAEMHQ